MRWRVLGLFIGVAAYGQASGQSLHDELSLSAQYGFFWAPSPAEKQLQSHHAAVFASVSPARWSITPGLERYRRGRYGATLGLFDFGLHSLGHAFALMPYFENASRKEGASHAFFYRLSGGPAALTHPYQIDDNPFNQAYAAPVAFCLQGRAGYEQRLGRLQLQAGVSFTHLSNGSFKLPNIGMNLPAVFVNLGYVRPNPTPRRFHPDSTHRTRHLFDVTVAAGPKSFSSTPAPVYFMGLGRLSYRWAYAARGDVAFGFDWIYNGSLREAGAQFGRPVSDYNRLGLTVGHEWYFSREFAFSAHVGIYVRDPLPIDMPVYQRYGIRFAARHRLQPAIWVRAHLGAADCMEFALKLYFPEAGMRMQFLLLGIMALAGCNDPNAPDFLKSTGSDRTETRLMPGPIRRLEVFDNIDVVLLADSGQAVTLTGGANVLPEIETNYDMADSSLHISNKNRYNWVRDYSRQIVLRVPAGRLAAYSHLGYGRLECPDTLRLQNPTFRLDGTATGKLIIRANNLTVGCNGLGDYTLGGRTRYAYFFTLKTCLISAGELSAQFADLNLGSRRGLRLRVRDSAHVQINSTGDAILSGKPRYSQDIRGAGRVVLE